MRPICYTHVSSIKNEGCRDCNTFLHFFLNHRKVLLDFNWLEEWAVLSQFGSLTLQVSKWALSVYLRQHSESGGPALGRNEQSILWSWLNFEISLPSMTAVLTFPRLPMRSLLFTMLQRRSQQTLWPFFSFPLRVYHSHTNWFLFC